MWAARRNASRWSACVALGLALILAQHAFAESKDIARRPPRESGSTQQHRREAVSPNPDEGIEGDARRIASALEAKNHYDQSSLGQQDAHSAAKAAQLAAGWASAMFWVGVVETLLTATGVFLVVLTLREAKRSADAAERNILETRRIGEAQVRAYISVPKCTASFHSNEGARLPRIEVSFKNSGLSPARLVVWNARIRYLNQGKRRSRSLTEAAEHRKWAKIKDIAGGDTDSSSAIIADMDIDNFVEIAPGQRADQLSSVVQVCINFAFKDVFDKENSGSAYFSGIVLPAVSNAQKVLAWRTELRPTFQPEDWDERDVDGP